MILLNNYLIKYLCTVLAVIVILLLVKAIVVATVNTTLMLMLLMVVTQTYNIKLNNVNHTSIHIYVVI